MTQTFLPQFNMPIVNKDGKASMQLQQFFMALSKMGSGISITVQGKASNAATVDFGSGFSGTFSGTTLELSSGMDVIDAEGISHSSVSTINFDAGFSVSGSNSGVTISAGVSNLRIAQNGVDIASGVDVLNFVGNVNAKVIGEEVYIQVGAVQANGDAGAYTNLVSGPGTTLVGNPEGDLTISCSGGVEYGGTLYGTIAAGSGVTITPGSGDLTFSASGSGSLYNRPSLSSFTWCNQAGVGASATDNTNGPLTITITNTVLNLSALTIPVPGSTWTIAAQLFSDQPSGNQFFGISLHDTLTGPALIFSVYAKSSAYIFRFTSPTSYNNGTSLSAGVDDPIWMKIVNDGTNLNYYVSADGFDYELAYSTTLTADLAAITHIGFAGTANNSTSNFHTKLYNWSLTSP
ncbi:MAG: hypothetical protein KGH91_03025 [Rhodospirillales bacterium]|nr:hypothetical protein [Rhodospirillales bacterium]